MRFAVGSAIYIEKEFGLELIHEVRKTFLDTWYSNEFNSPELYPNALIDFQQQIKEQGYLQHYDYIMMMHGNPEAFNTFYEKEEETYEAFFDWYNKYQIDLSKKPHCRLQY
ncbi:MAG: hypothetical protein AAFO94_02715 [Bacteroidota bacterium]